MLQTPARPAETVSLEELAHGDRVRLTFDPPQIQDDGTEITQAEGEVLVAAGRPFLAATSHKARLGMPRVIDLDQTARIVRLETGAEYQERRETELRGDLVFEVPATDAAGIEAQLNDLAQMIASESDTRLLRGRKGQLERQFASLCDRISLAEAKRAYLLTRARVGDDFHPWTTRHPEVFRNGCVRPLPSDFHPRAARRQDRSRRLEEAVRIFGEAEREVRLIASRFRALGYDVRRPHPNAQELLLRIRMGARMKADIQISASSNGFWSAIMRPPQNLREQRSAARCVREGHLETVSRHLAQRG